MKHKVTRHDVFQRFGILTSHLSVLALALIASYLIQAADCEAKEFDWADLGVLSNAKASLSNNASNNLRILVSPQRRMTKNYEFDYGNSSQPISTRGETSYLVSSSSYTPLSAQPQSSQSSAHSALSASLASLKSRLSARGINLPETNSQTNLYSNTPNSYPLSESQPHASQHTQTQPTYLSLTNSQQDPQQTIAYSTGHNQSNDNKTIVLAIPAKINFLTDERSGIVSPTTTGPKQLQQQSQQLTVLQQLNSQQPATDYQGKQIGIYAGSQEGNGDSNSQLSNQEQESPQYVILNSARATNNDQTSNLPIAQSQQAQANPAYSNSYPTIPQTGYNMKYMPNISPQVESPINDQYATDRYNTCLNTCNSADPRWRKYTVSKYKYCCTRSPQYDTQFDQSSPDRLSDSVSKFNDDAYYHYLYRKTRARRSRKPYRLSRYNRYSSIASSHDDESSSGESGSQESNRQTSGRPHHHDSPNTKYYKSRQQYQSDLDSTRDGSDSGNKYQKERSLRNGRSRDFDNYDSQQTNDQSEEESGASDSPARAYGYGGGGEHAIDNGRYPNDQRNEDEEARSPYEGESDQEPPKSGSLSEYSSDQSADSGPNDEGEPETATTHKRASERRKKYGKSWPRKYGKDLHSKGSKRSRKSRLNKLDPPSSHVNGTDYDSTQSGDQYNTENGTTNDEDHQRDNNDSGEADKDSSGLGSKYKSSLNETAVAHLSKTTMHLKEILSILEKKAQIKFNETANGQQATSTSSPATTTNLYPSSIFGSQSYGGSSLSSSDYLSSELGLKSRDRYEQPSLSSLMSSSSISLPPTYSSLTSDFSTLTGISPNHFGLSPKHLPLPSSHYPRKRRVNKNIRYNNMMLPKPHNLLPQSQMLNVANGKSALLSPTYYSLQYPYWYGRGSTIPATTAYPYKNTNKSPYSIINGQSSPKIPSSGGFYSDESRIHSLTNYDPLANVASSLRPSTTMRLRSKPFIFQPHVLPIYTRHTILAPTMDVKK